MMQKQRCRDATVGNSLQASKLRLRSKKPMPDDISFCHDVAANLGCPPRRVHRKWSRRRQTSNSATTITTPSCQIKQQIRSQGNQKVLEACKQRFCSTQRFGFLVSFVLISAIIVIQGSNQTSAETESAGLGGQAATTQVAGSGVASSPSALSVAPSRRKRKMIRIQAAPFNGRLSLPGEPISEPSAVFGARNRHLEQPLGEQQAQEAGGMAASSPVLRLVGSASQQPGSSQLQQAKWSQRASASGGVLEAPAPDQATQPQQQPQLQQQQPAADNNEHRATSATSETSPKSAATSTLASESLEATTSNQHPLQHQPLKSVDRELELDSPSSQTRSQNTSHSQDQSQNQSQSQGVSGSSESILSLIDEYDSKIITNRTRGKSSCANECSHCVWPS